MSKLVLIALGGALGALLRFALSALFYRQFGEAFPWGTLTVNLVGCFTIGLLWAFSEASVLPRTAEPFLFAGCLGAFTTFSTYGLESINLLRQGATSTALVYIFASNLLGLAFVVCGFLVARVFLLSSA